MKRPPRLFHCFSDKAKDVFKEWRLWLSAVKDFNDPFEGMPSFDGVVSKIVEDQIRRHYMLRPSTDTSSLSEFRQKMGAERASVTAECLRLLQENFRERSSRGFRMFCFTAKYPDVAMWGHYADSHRGFVVEFDSSHLLFDDLKEVIYQESRPEPKYVGDFRFLQIKDALWQSEAEYRLIKKVTEIDEGERSPGKHFRFIPLPRDAVKAVFFGCQMSPEVRHQMVRDIGAAQIQKFVMRPNTSTFGLEEIPIEERKAPAAADSGIKGGLIM